MGRNAHGIDWIILILLFILGTFGLFIQLTINPSYFAQQGMFFFAGMVLLLLLSKFDSILLWWFAPIGYIFGVILLAITLFGESVRGASRWIFIAGLQLQPSEVAKPIFLLFFAWLISKYPPRYIQFVPIHLLAALLPLLLIFRQPDLGTAIVYASFIFMMLVSGGLSLRLVGVLLLIFSITIPITWNHLAPYQQSRILTFLNPSLDPRGAGYNAIQSTIAVGSGQVFGRGLGRGTQSHLRFLPEHHTDFIFATLIEELGLTGGLLLFATFFLLLWKLILYLKDSRLSVFSFSFGAGLFGMITTQLFINAGMNMGIVPITGITLPFVSYGGSSILSFCISFGLLFALSGNRNHIGRSIAIA